MKAQTVKLVAILVSCLIATNAEPDPKPYGIDPNPHPQKLSPQLSHQQNEDAFQPRIIGLLATGGLKFFTQQSINQINARIQRLEADNASQEQRIRDLQRQILILRIRITTTTTPEETTTSSPPSLHPYIH